MNWKIACLALAAFALSGCEHPFANGGLQGLPPVESAVPAAVALETETEQAVRASATLQALLGRHGAASAGFHDLSRFTASAPSQPQATDSWLEEQSSALRSLVERARTARQALDAQPRD